MGVHFFLKKLRTFLVVILNTHAKTARLTTHSNPAPTSKKISLKIDFFLCLGVHLPLTPVNYVKTFFSYPAPTAPRLRLCLENDLK